jgi:hypothetical protein
MDITSDNNTGGLKPISLWLLLLLFSVFVSLVFCVFVGKLAPNNVADNSMTDTTTPTEPALDCSVSGKDKLTVEEDSGTLIFTTIGVYEVFTAEWLSLLEGNDNIDKLDLTKGETNDIV